MPGSPVRRQFDCSGLVTWALLQSLELRFPVQRGPNGKPMDYDWRASVDTDGLLKRCRKTSNPMPGTLVLYGPTATDMDHVMVYLTKGLVVGACGGGRKTLTVADALRDNARVQTRPGVNYRKDFRFFVEIPFADEQDAKGVA